LAFYWKRFSCIVLVEMKAKSDKVLAIQPRLRVKVGEEIALGPGRAELLGLVEQTGSITEAARHMGMSYMRAWQLIQSMNRGFKRALVTTTRGGKRGGGAVVTEVGRTALGLYQEMERGSLRGCEGSWRKLQQLLQR
jgi:molybdate transport system regulatory protein